MTFKQNWEKTETPVLLSDDIIKAMIRQACPEKKFSSYEIILGGCANLNIKLCFKDQEALLLRIYLRDPSAVDREQKIAHLWHGKIPIPEVLYKGKYQTYTFAILSFMPGITLRDLLLSPCSFDLAALLFEVGIILAQISRYKFPKAGFLNENLEITEETSDSSLLDFVKKNRQDQNLWAYLNAETLSRLHSCFENHVDFLPNSQETSLVHGDFDPANILVDQREGLWKVTGVLDWEFCFSGSTLWDVANMLRYAHHMPPLFTQAFLQGMQKGGITLPDRWQVTIYLLNLSSLLDMMTKPGLENRPQQRIDMRDLIEYFLQQLEK